MNYTVVDLFSGPGGFSEGFRQEGFDVLVGVDYDENSAKTYQHNHPESKFIQGDISSIDPQDVMDAGSFSPEEIDVVIGGPPCQGFSLAGNRDEEDDRNELFKEFADQISSLRPKYFVMENVTGLLSMDTSDGEPVIEAIHNRFSEIGYSTRHKTLTSSEYGAPQNRDRVFIIGTRTDNTITFPTPTHGEVGQQRLDTLDGELQPFVTVGDALSDLPSLSAGESATQYKTDPQNDFQEWMRADIDPTNADPLTNHDAVNHRDHIVTRFEHIPQGGNMEDAPEEHQPAKVYSSRNRRLPDDAPSYTVTSHVLDELIHPWDDRSITVREAARLQCFPDTYEFIGERNVFHGADETSQYEQVGNAVPVALSTAIARELKQYL